MQDKKEKRIAFLMILPSIIAVGVFVYGFIAWTVRVSFSAWRGMTPDYTFVGLKNYINLFVNNLRFQIDIKNTLIFTAIFVFGCLIIGLFSALLLDQGLKGEGFFRSLFIFPMAISYIVTGVVWRWLMNPAQGSRMSGLNLLFDKLGLDFLISNWTSTPVWGIAFLAIPAIWQLSGYTMAMYLAGLRAIPDELREAARVDGASEFNIFRYIILPLIRPVTLSAMVILGHMSLKTFDLVIATVGKQLVLDMPSVHMWQITFDGLQYGSGAAISILLLIFTAVLIVPYLFFSLRKEVKQ
ncbi:MAG TPA: sugar ABC transporter permease [Anaerolineaceae bacterium]|nr:sugar ABC transporter permease [Anaerolineaceae bacterium]HOV05817.1 sugar ABC transporter permease [Anaerolineaceae bacterium]